MTVPVYPTFEEDEIPAHNFSLRVVAGRLIVFAVAVRFARYVKHKYWPEELDAARDIWSATLRNVSTATFLIGFCLVVNILLSACLGIRIFSVGLRQPVPFLCTTPFLWILFLLFLTSQIIAMAIKAPPGLQPQMSDLFHDTAVRFALHLDLIGAMCVMPVFASLLYCGVCEMVNLSSPAIACALFVSCAAVLAPPLEAEPESDQEEEEAELEEGMLRSPKDRARLSTPDMEPFRPGDKLRPMRGNSKWPLFLFDCQTCTSAVLDKVQQIEAQQEARLMNKLKHR